MTLTPEGQKPWYEALFENYGRTYDKECFSQGTVGECDFIENELGRNKALRILDIGCGTGRHSIEMAKRGYKVTGIDLSESQLARAREKASSLGLTIDFQKQDARKLPFKTEFDLAIMLCEGAFPLMETDEMNFEILRNAAKSLKDHGKFIFTTLNGLFPLFNSIEKFCASTTEGGSAAYRKNTFDLMTFRDHNITTVVDDDGHKKELKCNERYYVPPEITWMLKSLGFTTIDIFGAILGAFSRNNKLTKDDFEMLVIAQGDRDMTISNDKKRMYNDLAWAFPIITPLRDYVKETESAFRLIRKHSRIPIRTLLHLGCGGGHNDFVFKRHAPVTGVDISPAMLKLARKVNPEAAYKRGDMKSARLKTTFDCVVAWDSLNHMLTTHDLAAAFATAHAHLNEGGVFFFLLDINKEQFQQNVTTQYSNRADDVDVTFIENLYDPDPADTTYESTLLFLIRRKGKLTIETDRFLCGLYLVKTVMETLRRSGFHPRFIKYSPGPEALENNGPWRQKYYPAFIAVKRPQK